MLSGKGFTILQKHFLYCPLPGLKVKMSSLKTKLYLSIKQSYLGIDNPCSSPLLAYPIYLGISYFCARCLSIKEIRINRFVFSIDLEWGTKL